MRSDPGRVRSNNEDAVGGFEPVDRALRAERGCLYVVADGMGGHAAGEVASNYAVASILRDYFTMPWEGPEPSLRAAIAAANAAIHAEGSAPGEHQGMGSTVVAAAVLPDRAVIANVGDSRAYLLRDGKLRQLSLDHSWVAERVAIGLLTPEQAAAHPGKNVLTRNLGFSSQAEPSVAEIALQAGDRLLLCSDGLSGPLSEEQMTALLGDGNAEQAATALIAAANEAGGRDNIGVVVLAPGAAREGAPQGVLEALPPPSWQPAALEPPPTPVQPTPPEPSSPSSESAPPQTPLPAAVAAPKRRHRLLLGAATAVVLVVGALTAGAVALAGRGGSSRKSAPVAAAAIRTALSTAAPAGGASIASAASASQTPAPTSIPSPSATVAPLLIVQTPAASATPAASPSPESAPSGPGDAATPGGPASGAAGGAPPTGTPDSGGPSSAGATAGIPGSTPAVVYQAHAGDTLLAIWQSCYTTAFPDLFTFAQATVALNGTGADLNNLQPGQQVTLPPGWSGANCPLNGSPAAPPPPPTRLNPGLLPRPVQPAR
jgi:serine/threonine protein phosphatase PrpC